MQETLNQVMKFVLGALLVAIVITAIGFFFGEKIIGFFRNLPGSEPATIKFFISSLA